MIIQEKLKIIQERSGMKQTELAQKFGVSFATFNAWYNQRSNPRAEKRERIDDFYLEITGKKQVTDEYLKSKKDQIKERGNNHSNILKEIISNPDIKQEFIIKLTYHSNKIEGSTLSEKDTASIIFDNVSLPIRQFLSSLKRKITKQP